MNTSPRMCFKDGTLPPTPEKKYVSVFSSFFHIAPQFFARFYGVEFTYLYTNLAANGTDRG